MIFKNGENLLEEIQEFIRTSERLIIIVPYIKNDSLTELVQHRSSPTEIIVRWQLNDLVTGASDLEIFDTCQRIGISLYRNPRIHLKCFINNFQECLMTTANISKRALSSDQESNFNHEVGTNIKNLTFEDKIYFQTILNESALVTPQTVERLKTLSDEREPAKQSSSNLDFEELHPDSDFLLSALPMSENVDILEEIYFKKNAKNLTDYNCAIHDLVLYHIENGLNEDEFLAQLKTHFFSHPFIKAFLSEVEKQGGAVHFGFVRRWLASNCTNVPLPRPWEVTTNVQILFRWIVDLEDGKYFVDVPHKYSERLKKIQ